MVIAVVAVITRPAHSPSRTVGFAAAFGAASQFVVV